MIRFIPDTLRDALWRPIAMGAPDAGVYVEIMAPDLRFAFLVLLTAAAAVLLLLRRPRMSPTWLLLAFVWLTFIPWLATTGNGRYFIAILLIVGPLCVAVIHQLPLTHASRLMAAALIIGVQGFALVQNNPWGWWALGPWAQPYFPVALTAQEREEPATYVTVSSISYSLIAPQFDERSRWMSVASLHGDPEHFIDDQRAQTFLQEAAKLHQPIKLVVPTLPDYMDGQRQPGKAIREEINRMLAPNQLGLEGTQACKMVESRGLASLALRHIENLNPATVAKFGFWICPLAYPVARPAPIAPSMVSRQAEQVFAKIELSCPRLFRSGEATSVRMGDGFSRTYPSADIKTYVLDSGDVLYKYWRGLNPGRLGTVDAVLAGTFKMDCNAIRGRSGLPWEREL
ncbi:MAG: hypothetical protein JWQ07_609 [Ramlibacter sp.]|nr:hypothetical protein [Ramlibacter sp.]